VVAEQAAAAATAATTMTTKPGHGRALFTADEGDADDREKHRDAENKCTIHAQLLNAITKNWYVPSG
jgi:hypothetical protein